MTFFDAMRWASVVLKVAATLTGLDAARRWHSSAAPRLDGAAAAEWNRGAARVTALSVILGAGSMLVDAIWAAPGVWGP